MSEELSSTATAGSPAVSVVIPSYNHARFVGACLRSIFRQTHAPRELVVIDDGSSDDSPRVIERALKEAPFPCKLLARENRGLSRTLNEAFARTSGDYFAYLGSDDIWLEDFLRARVKLLEARPRAVLAYGNAYHIDADDRIVDCTTDWAAYVDGDVRRMLLGALAPLSPTVVYRRRALERVNWNEEAQLEDYELYLRLSAYGEFAFDPAILAAWRVHGANASANLNMMHRERVRAQNCAASALGIDEPELARFRSLIAFRAAEELMRRGDKLAALKLVRDNARGIPSPGALARLLASAALPHSLLAGRKRRQRERAYQRYGTLPA